MASPLVPTKQADFLDQDPPLRGQNYVCLSFISPEEVIKRKDVWIFERFLEFFSKEMKEFFENLTLKYKAESDIIRNIQERYPYVFDVKTLTDEYNFYASKNNATLEKQYHEDNNFQTSIRGIKVRGCFETLKEAEVRAQVLKKLDDRFHVYVAEVGCWCPWSPNPDDISEQEYAETQLNTLMKGYKENQEKRDVFYQQRKTELKSLKPERDTQPVEEEIVPQDISDEQTRMEGVDPWMQRKTGNDDVNINELKVTE